MNTPHTCYNLTKNGWLAAVAYELLLHTIYYLAAMRKENSIVEFPGSETDVITTTITCVRLYPSKP